MNGLRRVLDRNLLLAVVLLFTCLACGEKDAADQEPPKPESGSEQVHHLYLVPGTYSNADLWSLIDEEKATFATELQRGLGDQWVVHPFLWRSSTAHENRRAAANRLANRIRTETSPEEPVSIVGFSHGGNVSLHAVDLVDRPIDTLVTLSTPHFHIITKKNEEELRFPIYCSAEARKRIGRLISVRAAGDKVVETYAGFRVGLNDNTALEMTRSWRKQAGNPRLSYDGGPFSDWAEDVLEVDMGGNIVVRPSLPVADENVAYLSFVESGIQKHKRAHSRRMGYMLGQVLSGKRDVDYLNRYVQPASVDDGEPEPLDKYMNWFEEHRTDFEVAGWRLTSLEVTLERNKMGYDLKSKPDLIPRIRSDGETEWDGEVRENTHEGTWQPERYILYRGDTHQLFLLDKDPLFQKEHISTPGRSLEGSTESPPPSTFDATEVHPWSAKLNWERIHH